MEDKIQNSKEGDSTTRETTSIQMEKEFQSNDSFEVAPEHEVNETNESQAPATRTINRERKHLGWHSDYVMESNAAMQEEIEALHKNKTWELMTLPGGRKPIGNKLMYKIKKNSDDQVERYRARLVVKGYAQKEGIDFNKIFNYFPLWFVVRMTTVRVVLVMCAMYDLHLEQLDVKTAFPHGNLEEEIYMLQPEDIAHVVGVVSRYMVEPSRKHWEAVKRILRYIKGTSDVALCFEESDLIVKGYVDSDYVGDIDGSKSAAQASKEAVWLNMLLEELGHEQEKITLFVTIRAPSSISFKDKSYTSSVLLRS
nr:Gag-Pol polyprotein [Tanacetum cinerariifolium]